MEDGKMFTILKTKNVGMENEARDFLKELIKIPSPSTHEKEVAEAVYNKMNELNYDDVYRDSAGNVIGVIRGFEKEPTVVLNSHLDTVPLNLDKWNHDPYAGTEEGNKIYGAGATDCKGGLVAQIFAGELLKRSLLPFKGNLVVAATVAEENGCSIGVKTLINETLPSLELNPDSFILGEPTNLGLFYGHDGRVEIDIKIEGNDSSQVDHCARNICKNFTSDRVGASKNHEISISNPEFKHRQNLEQASIHLEKKLHAGEDASSAAAWIKNEATLVANGNSAVAVQVEVVEDVQQLYSGKKTVVKHIVNAWQTDPFHSVMERARQSLAAAGCEVKPGKWVLGQAGMGTAGGVISNEFKIPVIGYGPGNENQAHQPDEYVELNKVFECIYGTASIVHGIIGIPVFGWTSDEI
jgi:putative selenium metabolism hydrolase